MAVEGFPESGVLADTQHIQRSGLPFNCRVIPSPEMARVFMNRYLTTSYGPALAAAPVGLCIPRDPVAALVFARRADHEADAALAAGRFEAAERLSHAALEARCRAGIR